MSEPILEKSIHQKKVELLEQAMNAKGYHLIKVQELKNVDKIHYQNSKLKVILTLKMKLKECDINKLIEEMHLL